MSSVIAKNVQVGTSGTATNNFTLYQPASPDGTVRLGVGNTGATTLDAVTVTSAGNVAVPSLTVSGNNISAVNSLGFRNRIINGDMRIDQRNAGASFNNAVGGVYGLDRWSTYGTQAAKFSTQRSTVAPAGFTNSSLITSLSAYSVLSSDFFLYYQNIEGFNIADLGWGTASASSVTLSFWVRSSLTGTFGGALQNPGGARSYPFAYTINSANTWEQKTVTIAGDTTGTWGTGNGLGIAVVLGLGVSSTYSGTAGAWAGANYYSATGATSVVGTNGATFYITGVQLEAGTVASPFERRDYGRELIMCQRYYERSADLNNIGVTQTRADTGSRTTGFFPFAVAKRSTPTISITAGSFTSPTGTWVELMAGYPTRTGTPAATTSAIVYIDFGTSTSGNALAGGWLASAEL